MQIVTELEHLIENKSGSSSTWWSGCLGRSRMHVQIVPTRPLIKYMTESQLKSSPLAAEYCHLICQLMVITGLDFDQVLKRLNYSKQPGIWLQFNCYK